MSEEVQEGQRATVLDELRRGYQEALDAKEEFIQLPGYGGKLWVKYRLLDIQEIRKASKGLDKEFPDKADQALYGMIDVMVAACEGLYYGAERNELRSLAEYTLDSMDDVPVKFDQRLATFLELESESARETVLALFGNNEIAAMEHARQVTRWMQGSKKSALEEAMEGI